jgi:hypothetical protein
MAWTLGKQKFRQLGPGNQGSVANQQERVCQPASLAGGDEHQTGIVKDGSFAQRGLARRMVDRAAQALGEPNGGDHSGDVRVKSRDYRKVARREQPRRRIEMRIEFVRGHGARAGGNRRQQRAGIDALQVRYRI